MKLTTLHNWQVILFALFFFVNSDLDAQTISNYYYSSPPISIDGNGDYGTQLPGINFDSNTLSSNCVIEDVDILIYWRKTDGTCAAPGSGDPNHQQTSFRLTGPTGISIDLIPPGSYTGTTSTNWNSTKFDEDSPNTIDPNPYWGTYNPPGDLDAFVGSQGTGTWYLSAGDNGINDPLCIYMYEIYLTVKEKTFTCPADLSVLADQNACVATAVPLGTAILTDNCNNEQINNNAPAEFPIGDTYVQWYVGNSVSSTFTCTQKVTVLPNETTLECPADIIVDTYQGYCFAYNVDLGEAQVYNNCNTSQTVTNDAPTYFPLGTTAVTWSLGNSTASSITCVQYVTVIDNEEPTIYCPSDITVETDTGNCFATNVALGNPYIYDNCNSNEAVTNDAPVVFPIGTTAVTWNVGNSGSSSSTCVQYVTVIDDEGPTINCPAGITVNTDPGNCFASNVPLGIATAYDNCNNNLNVINDAPAEFPVGTTVVTWSIGNSSSSSATCYQYVTVIDNEETSISCPANVIVENYPGYCFAFNVDLGEAQVYDNCNPSQTATNDAPYYFPLGTTTVTWSVGNSTASSVTCLQYVTVIDNEEPTIYCPSDITVQTDSGNCFATNVALGNPYIYDNCNSNEAVTNDAPIEFPIGTTAVTWNVGNSSSSSSTCVQYVTVIDDEGPTINCPADVTIDTDPGNCFATNVPLGMATAYDNCNSNLNVTNDAPLEFPVGTTVVTWRVGNSTAFTITCLQSVTVIDNEETSISCPANVIVENYPGYCFAFNVDLGEATIYDNCNASQTTSNDAPAYFPVGITTVTWSVGNSTTSTITCIQYVTVIDSEEPTIYCPADIIANTDPGNCFASNLYLGEAQVYDNCSGSQTATNDAPLEFPIGTTAVTWSVGNSSSSSSTCVQYVTVIDDEEPTITCPADITVETDQGNCVATNVVLGTATAYDNCNNNLSVTNDAPIEFPIGTTTVTWSIGSQGTTTATCLQYVTVNDDQAPVINCPADVTVNMDPGSCVATGVNLGSPTLSDNCSLGSASNNAPISYPAGKTTVVWTVTDTAGNTSFCEQEVTVLGSCSNNCTYALGTDSLTCANQGGSPYICIPLQAVSNVPTGIIGMDYCMEYDPALMSPTGMVELGDVVLDGSQSADYFINYATPGRIYVTIYYTSAAPDGAAFVGSGDVACIEFALNSNFTGGMTADFEACEVLESYQVSTNFACATDGSLSILEDDILEGTLMFWEDASRPLRFDTASPSAFLPTYINGTDPSCGNPTFAGHPDYNGYFEYDNTNGDFISFERDISGDSNGGGCPTDVMSTINGMDAYQASLVTTSNTTLIPSVFELIAMDVNLDGFVTAGDITHMQNRTVQNICEFPQKWNYPAPTSDSKDWLFVDRYLLDNAADFAISVNYPQGDGTGYHRTNVPEVPNCLEIQIDTQTGCPLIEETTFHAILLGDADGTWSSNQSQIRLNNANQVIFDLEEVIVIDETDCTVSIPVRYTSPAMLRAMDFVVDYDEDRLEFVGVEKTIGGTHLSTAWNDQDGSKLLLTAYSQQMGGIFTQDPVLNLIFRLNDGELLAEDFNILATYLNGRPSTPAVNGDLFECPSTTTGIEDVADAKGGIRVFPTLTGDLVTIDLGNNRADMDQILLIDVQGKVLQKETVNGGSFELSLAHLSAGLYFVRVNEFTWKVVKE